MNANEHDEVAQDVIHYVFLGQFQQGKSTMAKLLLPEGTFTRGDGCFATTQRKEGRLAKCRTIQVWDTPGANADEEHDKEWQSVVEWADVVIFVKMTEKDISEVEAKLLHEMADKGKKTILVLNCKGQPAGEAEANDPRMAESQPIIRSVLARNESSWKSAVFFVNLLWATVGRNLEKDEKERRKVFKVYKECYPDDEKCERLYERSGFDALRSYLMEPSAKFFSSDGPLFLALKSRILTQCVDAVKAMKVR